MDVKLLWLTENWLNSMPVSDENALVSIFIKQCIISEHLFDNLELWTVLKWLAISKFFTTW